MPVKVNLFDAHRMHVRDIYIFKSHTCIPIPMYANKNIILQRPMLFDYYYLCYAVFANNSYRSGELLKLFHDVGASPTFCVLKRKRVGNHINKNTNKRVTYISITYIDKYKDIHTYIVHTYVLLYGICLPR